MWRWWQRQWWTRQWGRCSSFLLFWQALACEKSLVLMFSFNNRVKSHQCLEISNATISTSIINSKLNDEKKWRWGRCSSSLLFEQALACEKILKSFVSIEPTPSKWTTNNIQVQQNDIHISVIYSKYCLCSASRSCSSFERGLTSIPHPFIIHCRIFTLL